MKSVIKMFPQFILRDKPTRLTDDGFQSSRIKVGVCWYRLYLVTVGYHAFQFHMAPTLSDFTESEATEDIDDLVTGESTKLGHGQGRDQLLG